jgi:hypothetical protein
MAEFYTISPAAESRGNPAERMENRLAKQTGSTNNPPEGSLSFTD